MLKLIALKPLRGCRKSVLKCLQVGRMYYLCNDYRISEDKVCLRDEYVRPLPEDFFSVAGDSPLSINISAVVGMNGDGKSSLIELMMRLINNCAKHYRLTYKDRLLRIEGIKAELYYLLDDVVYCIYESESDRHPVLAKCADISDKSRREWDIRMVAVKSVSRMRDLFYTIISNYSLYAYNIKDFKEEWNDKIQTDDEREKCWLHYLFHKNDGYRTPMTIHPYRDKGNIDINRESELTLQRLTALYIQEPDALRNPNSFRRIGDKHAETILLTDTGYSKLQENSIIQYFKNTRSISMMDGLIRKIESCIDKPDDIQFETIHDNLLEAVEESIDFLTGVNDPRYKEFLDDFKRWASECKLSARKIFSGKSDLRQLASAISNFYDNLPVYKYKYRQLRTKCLLVYKVNVKQLVRLRLIYEICSRMGIPLHIVFAGYENLSHIERCQHYMVYKIINICETYPKYIEVLERKGPGWSGLPTSKDSDVLREIITMLSDDNSHITVKLRQCINFIDTLSRMSDFLDIVATKNEEPDHTGFMPRQSWRIPLERLRTFYGLNDSFPLDLLPPPIFKTEIRYKTQDREADDIPYDYLSSGEKQLLNNVGVILYHLRNLDSVDNGETVCRNVNIILEEIELYFHPEYQRMIIKTLIEKLHGAGFRNIENINITFVTHSPFILSDIPMCNVLLLKNGRPTMSEMQENTFGANINGMLKNGFFLPSLPIGEFAHDKINYLFERLNRFQLEARSRTEREWFYSNIMRVGEPYIREQLMKLFLMHYPVEYHD